MKEKLKGLLLCLVIAVPAWLLGRKFAVVGGPVISILLGMIVGLFLKNRAPFEAGIKFTSKKILQWAVILLGVALISAFGPGRWRPLHFTLYFLLGWSGLVFLPNFYRYARTLLWFILAGGVVYTLGMIPFARNRKYDHCTWHLFVLAAAVLHWVGIYTQIY